ncbi:MAG: phage tail protein, partial [Deltaproteobacteria bacterium]|nr:phage tail protein [Deltaproteobacteria bacterium]
VRISTGDIDLEDDPETKAWLHIVTQRLIAVFLRSNLYRALPTLYADMGTFATGAMLIEEDFDHVVRFYTFPIGSYMLALDEKLRVSVFYREFRYTVRQIVAKFGMTEEGKVIDWSVISNEVKTCWDNKQFDQLFDICHVIEPNQDFNPNLLGSKKFNSLYYEKGKKGKGTYAVNSFLRERGYDDFPVLCGRWETTGEDVYGTQCPGMVALGDIKALQLLHKRKLQAIEKMVNPPMTGPTAMKKGNVSILPGDMTYADEGQSKGFRPAHEVNLRLADIKEEIREVQARIQKAFYEDLFLMLASTDRREITAREIDERHEEKLLALGPVLEQLNQDILDPLIDITFNIMLKQGLIPEPPEVLRGEVLKVEYISIMHQAQKLAGLSAIEKLARFTGELAQVNPEVLDKVDFDELVEEYAEIVGVPPKIVLPEEEVDAIRIQRAEAEAAAAQAEQVNQMSGAAKNLAGADLEGNNALSALLAQAQGQE